MQQDTCKEEIVQIDRNSICIYNIKGMPAICQSLSLNNSTIPTVQDPKMLFPTAAASESSVEEQVRDGSEGKWSEQENLQFCLFVNYFQDIFSSKHKRKACRIFKTFTQYLVTRSPSQCRSHFQKMMEKHRSITKMKRHYRNLIGETSYQAQLKAFKERWEQHHQPLSKLHPHIIEFRDTATQTDPSPSTLSLCTCSQPSTSEQDLIKQGQGISEEFLCRDGREGGVNGWNYMVWVTAPSYFSPFLSTSFC